MDPVPGITVLMDCEYCHDSGWIVDDVKLGEPCPCADRAACRNCLGTGRKLLDYAYGPSCCWSDASGEWEGYSIGRCQHCRPPELATEVRRDS